MLQATQRLSASANIVILIIRGQFICHFHFLRCSLSPLSTQKIISGSMREHSRRSRRRSDDSESLSLSGESDSRESSPERGSYKRRRSSHHSWSSSRRSRRWSSPAEQDTDDSDERGHEKAIFARFWSLIIASWSSGSYRRSFGGLAFLVYRCPAPSSHDPVRHCHRCPARLVSSEAATVDYCSDYDGYFSCACRNSFRAMIHIRLDL
ncbi:hypothetical protein K1719_007078 [Acacia pycnantha]|nr:hypothetical protein K1719_007078 [Acacia pycnantha]